MYGKLPNRAKGCAMPIPADTSALDQVDILDGTAHHVSILPFLWPCLAKHYTVHVGPSIEVGRASPAPLRLQELCWATR
jgi:hypothetical protein